MVLSFFKSVFKMAVFVALLGALCLAILIFVVPSILPQDVLKQTITQFAKERLDIEIIINGQVAISLAPEQYISFSDTILKYKNKEYKISQGKLTIDIISNSIQKPLNIVSRINDVPFNVRLETTLATDDNGVQKYRTNIRSLEPIKSSITAIYEKNDDVFNIEKLTINTPSTKGVGRLKVFPKEDGIKDIDGEFNFQSLNIDEFIALLQSIKSATTPVIETNTAEGKITNKPKTQWKQSDLNFDFINKTSGKLKVTAYKMKIADIDLDNTVIETTSSNNVLVVDLVNADTNGGTANGILEIDNSNDVVYIKKDFNFENINIGAFVRKNYNIKWLKGSGNLAIKLNSKGNSEHEMVGNLNGQGHVTLNEGALMGIDLLGMADTSEQAIDKSLHTKGKISKIDKASASFKIKNGIINNNDLKYSGPFTQLSGEGIIDLPNMLINYTLTPNIGVQQIGLRVPLQIKGDLKKPKIRAKLNLDTVIKNVDQLGIIEKVKPLNQLNKEIQKLFGKDIFGH